MTSTLKDLLHQLVFLACFARTSHGSHGSGNETCWCGGFDLRVVTFGGELWRAGGYNGYRLMADVGNDVDANASVCSSDLEYSNLVQRYTGSLWFSLPEVPSWTPRHSFGFLAFTNKLWVIGGQDGLGLQADVWHSTTGRAWTQATSVAAFSPRSGFAAIALDVQKMLVIGGEDETGLKSDIWASVDGAVWTLTTASAPWSERRDFAVTFLGGSLWLAGGYDGGPCADVWSSSDTGATWQQAASAAPWGPRPSPGLVGFASRLWLIGGYRYRPQRNLRPQLYQRHWSPSRSKKEIIYPSRRLALSDLSFSGGLGLPVMVSRVQSAGLAATHGVKVGDELVSVGVDMTAFKALDRGGLASAPPGPLQLGFTDPKSADPATGVVPHKWYINYAGNYLVDIWSSVDGATWTQASEHEWTGLQGCKDAFAAVAAETGPLTREQRLVIMGATGERYYETSPVYIT